MGKSFPDDVIDGIVEATSFKSMKTNKSTNPDMALDEAIDKSDNKSFMRKGEYSVRFGLPGDSVQLHCFVHGPEVCCYSIPLVLLLISPMSNQTSVLLIHWASF